MSYLPDAHRPKADDDLAGCWAGGNRACGAPAEEPSGLCPDHLAEITSGDRREEPSERFAVLDLTELQDAINDSIYEMVAEMEPAVRSILVHAGALPDPEEGTSASVRPAPRPFGISAEEAEAAGVRATFWIADELQADAGSEVFVMPAQPDGWPEDA